jgi:hypothetical protein
MTLLVFILLVSFLFSSNKTFSQNIFSISTAKTEQELKSNIEIEQENNLTIFNKYLSEKETNTEFGYTIKINEYVTPKNEKGYYIIYKRNNEIKTIGYGIDNKLLTNDWYKIEKTI